ncbi:hypothetical protein QOM21_33800 [Streptomyces sp. Pv4-95]|uniref:hypothetical protein n=1 Tax=Streptomyces sp. Pv4-95 TaxID=3049543 RepID=UPI00389154A7
MTKHRKSSQPKMGEGPSRHKGSDQHGWSPDIDEAKQQKNPSAERSFDPQRHAPDSPPRRETAEEDKVPPASEVKSTSRSGERIAAKESEKGMRDTGEKGPSRRPSGRKDAEAHTGVDPQNPKRNP